MFLQVLQHSCLTSASEITQRDPKKQKNRSTRQKFHCATEKGKTGTGRNSLQPGLMWIWRSEGGVAMPFPDETKVKENIFLLICQFCTSITLYGTEAKTRRKYSAQMIHPLNVSVLYLMTWFVQIADAYTFNFSLCTLSVKIIDCKYLVSSVQLCLSTSCYKILCLHWD